MEIAAGQERAVAQHNAARMREEAKRLLSRQRAGLGASGFDATDATATALATDTESAATLEELLTMAQAEERARLQQFAASNRRLGGKQARKAGQAMAGGTLISGAYDIGKDYGLTRGIAKAA